MRGLAKVCVLLATLVYAAVLALAIIGGVSSVSGTPSGPSVGALLAGGVAIWATKAYLIVMAVLSLMLIAFSLAAPAQPKRDKRRVPRSSPRRRPARA